MSNFTKCIIRHVKHARLASTVPVSSTTNQNEILINKGKLSMDIPKIKINSKIYTFIFRSLRSGLSKYKQNFKRESYFENVRNKHGPIVRTGKIGKKETVVHLFDPKDVETLFRSEDHSPIKDVFEPMHMARKEWSDHLSQTGMILTNGEAWYDIRKKANIGTLKIENIIHYYPKFDRVAKEFVNHIANITSQTGTIDSVYEELSKWSMESIGRFLFGYSLDAFDMNNNKTKSDAEIFIKSLDFLIKTTFKLQLGFPWYRWIATPSFRKLVKAQKTISEMVLQHIFMTLERIKVSPTLVHDYFLFYLISRNDTDMKDIIGTITDLLFAAIDTTTSMSTMLMYHLARHTAIQDKVYTEIRKAMTDPKAPITSNEIQKMPYLRACMKETLRLTPVVDVTSRILKKDLILSGYQIPARTNVIVHHRLMSKTCFEDPNVFMPERWLMTENNKYKPQPFSYLPFGHGIRMCVGRRITQMETMVLFARLLEKYELSNETAEDVHMVSGMTNFPNRPIKIKFHQRR